MRLLILFVLLPLVILISTPSLAEDGFNPHPFPCDVVITGSSINATGTQLSVTYNTNGNCSQQPSRQINFTHLVRIIDSSNNQLTSQSSTVSYDGSGACTGYRPNASCTFTININDVPDYHPSETYNYVQQLNVRSSNTTYNGPMGEPVLHETINVKSDQEYRTYPYSPTWNFNATGFVSSGPKIRLFTSNPDFNRFNDIYLNKTVRSIVRIYDGSTLLDTITKPLTPGVQQIDLANENVVVPYYKQYRLEYFEQVQSSTYTWNSPNRSEYITIPCPEPSMSIKAIDQVGIDASPNQLTINYQPQSCSGSTTGRLEILDSSNTVIRTVNNSTVTSGDNVVDFATISAIDGEMFTARYTVVPTNPSATTITDTQSFTLPCEGIVEASINDITNASASSSTFSVTSNYKAYHSCNDNMSGTLYIKDGATTIWSRTKTGLGTGDNIESWTSIPRPEPGQTYTAEVVYYSNGKSLTISKDFTVQCDKSWTLGSLSIDPATKQASATVTGGFACHNGGTADLAIEKNSTTTHTQSDSLNAAPSPTTYSRQFSLGVPVNQEAGDYTARLTFIDGQGQTQTQTQSFSVGCPAPDITFDGQRITPLIHDPFELDFTYQSEDVCNGMGTVDVEFRDSSNTLVATDTIGSLTAGANSPITAQVSPLEPGDTYSVTALLNTAGGQTQVRNFSITVPCAEGQVTPTWGTTDLTPGSGSFSINESYDFPFACNSAISAALEIKNSGGNTIVSQTQTNLPSGVTDQPIIWNFTELTYGETFDVTTTYRTASNVTYSHSRTITIPCPSWWQPEVSSTNTSSKFLNFQVNQGYVCNGALDYQAIISKSGTTVETITGTVTANTNPKSFQESFTLASLPSNQHAGTYDVVLQMTDPSGTTRSVSDTFVIACPIPDLSWVSQATTALSDDPFSITFRSTSQDVCHTSLAADVLIQDGGTTVRSGTVSGGVAGQDTDLSYSFTPLEPGKDYTASITLNATSGQTFTRDFDFHVTCVEGEVTGQVGTITANPGDGQFSYETSYSFPFTCNLPIDATLEIVDTQSNAIVHTNTRTSLPSGVTDQTLNWVSNELEYGRDYLVRIHYITDSGNTFSFDKTFTVPCPSWWSAGINGIDQATKKINSQVTGAFACNGPLDGQVNITKAGATVETLSVPLNLVGDPQQQIFDYTLASVPANQLAGDYIVELTYTDQQGHSELVTDTFTIACPALDHEYVSGQLTAMQDDPFSFDFRVFSPDVCHGAITAQVEIRDGATTLNSGTVNSIPSGVDSVQTYSFAPLEPGKTYQALVNIATADSVITSHVYDLDVQCVEPPVPVTINNTSTIPGSGQFFIDTVYSYPYQCNLPVDATIDIQRSSDDASVFQDSKIDLPSGVTDKQVVWSFPELEYGIEYTAIIEFTTAGGNQYTYTHVFDVPCPSWWVPSIVDVNTSSGKLDMQLANTESCNGPIDYTVDISKSGTSVESFADQLIINQSLQAFSETYTLSSVPNNQRAGTYTVSLSATDAQGNTKTATTDFDIACPAPSSALVSQQVTALQHDPFNLTFDLDSPDVCHVALDANLRILDQGAEVATGSAIDLTAGQLTQQTFNFAPLDPGKDYIAQLTLTTDSGQTVSNNYAFHVTCVEPPVDHAFTTITANPGDGQFTVDTQYTYPFACALDLDAELVITERDSGDTVHQDQQLGLSSGVTDQPLLWTTPELTYGLGYTATVTYTTDSGAQYTFTQDFDVACPDWWSIASTQADAESRNVQAQVDGAYVCNGPMPYQLQISKDTQVVETLTGNQPIATQSQAFSRSFTLANLPANATAGDYTYELSFTDLQGRSKSTSGTFTIACPAVSQSFVDRKTTALVHDPFSLVFNVDSPDVCHGAITANINITQAGNSVVTGTLNNITSGTATDNQFDYAPVEPGLSYEAEVVVTTQDGQSSTSVYPFFVQCQEPPVGNSIVSVTTDVGSDQFTLNSLYTYPYSCNAPIDAKLRIIDLTNNNPVHSDVVLGLASGVTDEPLNWSFDALTFGRNYEAQLTFTTDSGNEYTTTHPFSVPCPDHWSLSIDSVDGDNQQSRVGVSNSYQCNGPASVQLIVHDANNIEVANETITNQIMSDGDFNWLLGFSLTNALNERAGFYNIQAIATDQHGYQHSATDSFIIACPLPELAMGSKRLNTSTDDPFEIDFIHRSQDLCHGSGALNVVISDQSNTPLHTLDYSNLTAGSDSTITASFPVLEPSNKYNAFLTLTNQAGQTVERNFEFMVDCQDFTFDITPDYQGVDVAIDGYACNLQGDLQILVLDSQLNPIGNGDTVPGALNLRVPLTYTINERSRGGTYQAVVDITDQNSFHQQVIKDFHYPCFPTEFSELTDLNSVTPDGEFRFTIQADTMSSCNGDVTIDLQVLDSGSTEVFSQSDANFTGGQIFDLEYVIPTLTGGDYVAQFTATNTSGDQTTVTRPFTVTCVAPIMANAGLLDPRGQSFGGLFIVNQCDQPAQISLTFSDQQGVVGLMITQPMVSALNSKGENYSYIDPVDISSLADGLWTVDMSFSGTTNTSETYITQFNLDRTGPQLVFKQNNQVVPYTLDAGQVTHTESLSVNDWTAIGYQIDDPAGGLPHLSPSDSAPMQYPLATEIVASALSLQAHNGRFLTVDTSVVNTLDKTRVDQLKLLIDNGNGTFYTAEPTVRYFDPQFFAEHISARPTSSQFDHLNLGTRFTFDFLDLPSGNYAIIGILAHTSAGWQRISVLENFTVPEPVIGARPQLTQDSSTWDLLITANSDTHYTLTNQVVVLSGDYQLQAFAYDALGNAGLPTEVSIEHTRPLEIERVRLPVSASFPGVDQFLKIRNTQTGDSIERDIEADAWITSATSDVTINGQVLTNEKSRITLTYVPGKGHKVSAKALDAVFHEVRLGLYEPFVSDYELELYSYEPAVTVSTFSNDHVVMDPGLSFYARGLDRNCGTVLGETLYSQKEIYQPVCAIRWINPPAGFQLSSKGNMLYGAPSALGTLSIDYEYGILYSQHDEVGSTFYPVGTDVASIEIIEPAPPTFTFYSRSRFKISGDDKPSEVGVDQYAGVIMVHGDLPSLDIDIQQGSQSTTQVVNDYRYFYKVLTNFTSIWETETVSISATYDNFSSQSASETYRLVGIPKVPMLTADPILIHTSTNPVSFNGRVAELNKQGTFYDPAVYGVWDVSVNQYQGGSWNPIGTTQTNDSNGYVTFDFASLPPGKMRYHMEGQLQVPAGIDLSLSIRSSTVNMTVYDGSPIIGTLSAYQLSGAIDFNYRGRVAYARERHRDIGEIMLQTSTDGSNFVDASEPNVMTRYIGGTLTEEGQIHYRARITNQHSSAVTFTDPITFEGFILPKVVIDGYRYTFVNSPITLTATEINGLPTDYVWELRYGSEPAQTFTGDTLIVPADQIGSYNISLLSKSSSAPDLPHSWTKKYYRVYSSAPVVARPSISGPHLMELDKTYTVALTLGEIFGGDTSLTQSFEWTLPDGTVITSDTFDFTPTDLDLTNNRYIDIKLENWVNGYKADTLNTVTYRAYSWEYLWPTWSMSTSWDTKEAFYYNTLRAYPTSSINTGGENITYNWILPPQATLNWNKGQSVNVYFDTAGTYTIGYIVSDERGNSETITQTVEILPPPPFSVNSTVYNTTVHGNAPSNVYLAATHLTLVPMTKLTKYEFYVDGIYVGESSYYKLPYLAAEPGQHELRIVAHNDQGETTESTSLFTIGENQPHTCTIIANKLYSEGKLGSVCDDVENNTRTYEWYIDGALRQSGSEPAYVLESGDLGNVGHIELITKDSYNNTHSNHYYPTW